MELLATMNPAANSSSYARCNNLKALLLLTGLFISFHLQSQHHYRGLVLEDDRYNKLPLSRDYGKQETLPAFFSLKEYIPRVVTQAGTNTAVAWNVTWYAHTIAEARRRNILATDPMHRRLTRAPGYTYRLSQPKEGCEEPISLIDALRSLQTAGAPRFHDFSDFCPATLPADLAARAAENRLEGFVRLFNTYDPKETRLHAIKKAIKSGSPVVLGFICPPSFQFAGEFWQPREPEPLKEYGGHTVTIFGYDDRKFGGAFQIVNSWGIEWADRGTTWFRYDDVANYALYGFQVLSPSVPLHGDVSFFTTGDNPMPVVRNKEGAYEFSRPYATGDPFRMAVTLASPAFCSVVAIDPAGQRGQMFPADTTLSPLVTARLTLPDEFEFYPLTEPAGRNVLHFIFSTDEKKLAEQTRRILNGYSPYALDLTRVKLSESKVTFESPDDTLVLTVVLNQRAR